MIEFGRYKTPEEAVALAFVEDRLSLEIVDLIYKAKQLVAQELRKKGVLAGNISSRSRDW